MGWTFYNSSGQRLQTFGFVAATQAEMEAGSSTTAYVTPGRTHNHPGVAKVWCVWGADAAIDDSYNVASITDTGPGDWTVVVDTDFSSINWAPVAYYARNAGSNDDHMLQTDDATTAGGFTTVIVDLGTGADVEDSAGITSMAGFGDQ